MQDKGNQGGFLCVEVSVAEWLTMWVTVQMVPGSIPGRARPFFYFVLPLLTSTASKFGGQTRGYGG